MFTNVYIKKKPKNKAEKNVNINVSGRTNEKKIMCAL